MARCEQCPPDDETARMIAEAFGLAAVVYDTPGAHYICFWKSSAPTRRHPTDEAHRAMWHALVRCYATLVDYEAAKRVTESYRSGEQGR